MSPQRSRLKYSGGPKARANFASGGARNMSPTTLSVPAIYDPIAAIARAGPARPFWAMAYPSMQVTTEAASPGMRIKMEVVEPPYMAP